MLLKNFQRRGLNPLRRSVPNLDGLLEPVLVSHRFFGFVHMRAHAQGTSKAGRFNEAF